jgi:DNA-binding NarL/FixJ family response regulator
MIRVLVADDEPLIRAGICTVLSSAADAGHAAVEQAVSHRVDVALLDIRMPALDGLGAAEELRRLAPDVRTVLLTSFSERSNVERALRGGAVGFVLKNCTPDELIGAVRAAHGGDAYLSPAVTRVALDLIPPAEPAPQPGRVPAAASRRVTEARLTPRESQVLDLVAEGLSNADIARQLRMTEASIKTYVSRILTKLGCGNRVQAALTRIQPSG